MINNKQKNNSFLIFVKAKYFEMIKSFRSMNVKTKAITVIRIILWIIFISIAIYGAIARVKK